MEGDNELVVTKVFNVSCEAVWNAWTKPEQIAQWFAPGVVMQVRELDARPGGHFRFADPNDPDSGEYTGEYLTIDPLKEISFKVLDFSDDSNGIANGFKIEFESVGEHTKLTLTAIPSENSYDKSTFDAWTGCFERMEKVVYNSD